MEYVCGSIPEDLKKICLCYSSSYCMFNGCRGPGYNLGNLNLGEKKEHSETVFGIT